MPYLDAALAFALTMLAVSTLVTQIVRLVQNMFKVRTKVLKEMLNEYFTTELEPVIKRELNRLQQEIKADVASQVETHAAALTVSMPFKGDELKKLIEVSTEELTERLKRSDLGGKLLQELGNKANIVFYELGQRYEIVGNRYTESFRARSRFWTTIVAFILAFVLNIDSLYIANTYIKNEGMRQAVIAQKDSLEEGYKTLAEKLELEQNKTEITKAEFEQAFSDSQKQLDVFTSAGFPIGWSYFPYVCKQKPESPDCLQRDIPFEKIIWVIGCILTGLLAGLGAPFWYDAVTGISRAVQSVRIAKKPDAET